MIWAIDMDGVITSNPDFFKWWTYQLHKNGHEIYIVSARNPKREQETLDELKHWGITSDHLIMMTDQPRDHKSQAEWKVAAVKEYKIDIWLDNDFKIYEKVLGVDTNIEGVTKLEI